MLQKKEFFITTNFPPQIGGIEECVFNLCKHWQNLVSSLRKSDLTGGNDMCSTKREPVDNFLKQPQKGRSGKIIVLAQTNHKLKDLEFQFDQKQNFKIFRQPLEFKFLRPKWLLSPVFAYSSIKQEQIKRVHAASGFASYLSAYVLKMRLGLPYLIYAYGLDLLTLQRSNLKRLLLKNIFRAASGFVANSNFTRRLMKEFYYGHTAPIKEAVNKFLVLYPGVDLEIFRPGLEVESLQEKYGLKGKKIILSVGRTIERKGFDQVIEAMPLILKQVPNVVYLIIGQGPFKKKLELQARSLSVQTKVRFLGRISKDRLPYFYNLCDFLIMPSRFIQDKGDVEGFGKVFLEANACSKPVIGGNAGGVPEAVIDGLTGFLVNPVNPQEIAEKAVKLLKDQALSEKLGRLGRERVEKKFSWDKLIQDFYYQLESFNL